LKRRKGANKPTLESSAEQPSLMLSPTSDKIQAGDFAPTILVLSSAALAVALVALVYFGMRKQ
jgi:hypothetical protein